MAEDGAGKVNGDKHKDITGHACCTDGHYFCYCR